MAISYRHITGPAGDLAQCVPFDGNSLSGSWNGDRFEVRSYATVIATYDKGTGEIWVSDRFYSVTTSKHQNYARAWLAYGDARTHLLEMAR